MLMISVVIKSIIFIVLCFVGLFALDFLRQVFFRTFFPSALTEEVVVRIATEACMRNDLPFNDMQMQRTLRTWHVRTNTKVMGCNAIIIIDCTTGEVLRTGMLER